MLKRLIPIFASAAVVVSAAPAAAVPVVDRAQVGVPKTATRAFSSALSVTLTSAEGYTRGCCYDSTAGQWTGPNWNSTSGATDASHIDWAVRSLRSSKSTAALARAAGRSNFPETAAGAVKVRHVVAGRTVGTLRAFQALDTAPSPRAVAQGALAVDLGKGVKSLVTLDATDPAVDSEPGLGTLTVQGRPASTWNREQTLAALKRVYIEGSLPPRKVTGKARGKSVNGKVSDAFGHPVAETKVTLVRGSKKVASGVTSNRGAFKLNAPGAGTYRVLAVLAGTKARSATIRVR